MKNKSKRWVDETCSFFKSHMNIGVCSMPSLTMVHLAERCQYEHGTVFQVLKYQ